VFGGHAPVVDAQRQGAGQKADQVVLQINLIKKIIILMFYCGKI
jgi:hypothetical protein